MEEKLITVNLRYSGSIGEGRGGVGHPDLEIIRISEAKTKKTIR
jgi:hypothetical protein